MNTELIRTFEQVQANVISGNELLLDTREVDEFDRVNADGRVNHIANSVNLPMSELFDANTRGIKDTAELLKGTYIINICRFF